MIHCYHCLMPFSPGREGAAALYTCPHCREQVLVVRTGRAVLEADRIPPLASVLVADVPRPLRGEVIFRLHGAGLRVVLADDGVQAWEVLQSGTVDALLISPVLPKVLGLEVVERLRREEEGGRLPVFWLGAIHRASAYRRGPSQLYGADGYLDDSSPPEEWLRTLGELLSRDLLSAAAAGRDASRSLARSLVSHFALNASWPPEADADKIRRDHSLAWEEIRHIFLQVYPRREEVLEETLEEFARCRSR